MLKVKSMCSNGVTVGKMSNLNSSIMIAAEVLLVKLTCLASVCPVESSKSLPLMSQKAIAGAIFSTVLD